jgi:hypothetical protein
MSLSNAQKFIDAAARQVAKDDKALSATIRAVQDILNYLAAKESRESKARIAPNAVRKVHRVTK